MGAKLAFLLPEYAGLGCSPKQPRMHLTRAKKLLAVNHLLRDPRVVAACLECKILACSTGTVW